LSQVRVVVPLHVACAGHDTQPLAVFNELGEQ